MTFKSMTKIRPDRANKKSRQAMTGVRLATKQANKSASRYMLIRFGADVVNKTGWDASTRVDILIDEDNGWIRFVQVFSQDEGWKLCTNKGKDKLATTSLYFHVSEFSGFISLPVGVKFDSQPLEANRDGITVQLPAITHFLGSDQYNGLNIQNSFQARRIGA